MHREALAKGSCSVTPCCSLLLRNWVMLREVLAPSTTLCCFTASKCLGGFCSRYMKRGSKTKVSESFTAFRGKAGEGFVIDLKASET